MKLIFTIILTGLAIAGIAQKNNQVIKSVDDDGRTLTLSLKVKNEFTSVDFARTFDITGLSTSQKDDLINRVVDSLGLNNYFKPTLTNNISYTTSEREKVAAAAMDYVDAFYFGDTSLITRSISPDVKKWGYSRRKDSANYLGMAMSYPQMINYVLGVKAKNDTATARKLYKKVEVLDYQDQTAAAKVTAWWGTDYILMGKVNGKWTITHVLWQSPPAKQ